MDLHRLRLLCEVADRGSLSAAASALSYSTSSVSEQIAVLEREAGLELLERGPRGVRPTEAGRLVVSRARELLAGVTALRTELDDLAGLRAGRLHVGAFPTAGVSLVPRAVAAFRARHPDVGLELTEADPDDALLRLAARELDMALVYRFEHYEEAPEGRHEEVELLTDELRVVLPAGPSPGPSGPDRPRRPRAGSVDPGRTPGLHPQRPPGRLPRRRLRAARRLPHRRRHGAAGIRRGRLGRRGHFPARAAGDA